MPIEGCAPNPRRMRAVEQGNGRWFGVMNVFYAEYGMGAEIVSEAGWLIADFPNHLDAERFMQALPVQRRHADGLAPEEAA